MSSPGTPPCASSTPTTPKPEDPHKGFTDVHALAALGTAGRVTGVLLLSPEVAGFLVLETQCS